jgi:hypothetical protein
VDQIVQFFKELDNQYRWLAYSKTVIS